MSPRLSILGTKKIIEEVVFLNRPILAGESLSNLGCNISMLKYKNILKNYENIHAGMYLIQIISIST